MLRLRDLVGKRANGWSCASWVLDAIVKRILVQEALEKETERMKQELASRDEKIESLQSDHASALQDKDLALKALQNEMEQMKQELASRDARISSLVSDHTFALAAKDEELSSVRNLHDSTTSERAWTTTSRSSTAPSSSNRSGTRPTSSPTTTDEPQPPVGVGGCARRGRGRTFRPRRTFSS